jgi:hypothetical protein
MVENNIVDFLKKGIMMVQILLFLCKKGFSFIVDLIFYPLTFERINSSVDYTDK